MTWSMLERCRLVVALRNQPQVNPEDVVVDAAKMAVAAVDNADWMRLWTIHDW